MSEAIRLNLGEWPSDKQRQLFEAKRKYVAYGGARGGGKSWSARAKSTMFCMRHAMGKVLIVRQTYPELEKNYIQPMRLLLLGVAKYNDKLKMFTFPNGATITFMYCRNDKDLGGLQGAEYDLIFIDEATNLSEFQLRAIAVCARGTNGLPKRVYFMCNPGGQGHQFIKRVFIDRAFHEDEDPDEYEFIQAKATDNHVLMRMQPDYVKQLDALPPSIRAAWRDGDWNMYAGQFFEEFKDDPDHYVDRRWTHVIEPFPPERHWPIYRSFDWGRRRPFSCGWWTIDHDGIAYRILELYGVAPRSGGQGFEPDVGLKWDADQVFTEIARIEREHPWLKGKSITGVADPAIWQKDTGISTNDVAVKHGVYFVPGDHSRIPGWLQFHARLRFSEEGIPSMYFYKTCKHLIRTIPLQMYDENRPEDLDSKGEDHAVDDVRYFCMMHPLVPIAPEEPKPLMIDPLKSMDVQLQRYRRAI